LPNCQFQFAVFDADKDNRIDYHEFRFGLRALGFDLPKQETYPYLTKYGIPPLSWAPQRECGPVWREFTQQTFQAIAGSLMYNRDPVDECRRAYRLFDVDGKDMITVEDLRRVMKEIGQSMEETELAAMIREFDSDGKGCVLPFPYLSLVSFSLVGMLTMGKYRGVNEDEFCKIMLAKRQG
jgi:centrin-3